MENFLLDLVIVFSIFWFIFEFATIVISGKPLKNKVVEEYIESYGKLFNVNPYCSNIISPLYRIKGDNRFIAKPPFSILFKYYIEGVGVVFRWSKGQRLIDSLYKQDKHGTKSHK